MANPEEYTDRFLFEQRLNSMGEIGMTERRKPPPVLTDPEVRFMVTTAIAAGLLVFQESYSSKSAWDEAEQFMREMEKRQREI